MRAALLLRLTTRAQSASAPQDRRLRKVSVHREWKECSDCPHGRPTPGPRLRSAASRSVSIPSASQPPASSRIENRGLKIAEIFFLNHQSSVSPQSSVLNPQSSILNRSSAREPKRG